MGLNRNIKNADPILQDAWHWSKREYERWNEGYTVELNEVSRSLEVERAYYAQGRKSLAEINKLRKEAGLWEIGAKEAKKIVTKLLPGQSKHGVKPLSAAIDAYIYFGGKIVNDIKQYKIFADIMRDRQPSITWGGDWDGDGRSDDEKFLDLVHFEI